MRCALAFFALCLVGCVATPKPLPAKNPEYQQLSDIPVPRYFNFQSRDSLVLEEPFRSCRLHYDGPGWLRPPRVLEFYVQRMAAKEWKFIRSEGVDVAELVFRKGEEECRVRSVPTDDGESNLLTIEVRPAS